MVDKTPNMCAGLQDFNMGISVHKLNCIDYNLENQEDLDLINNRNG